MVRFWFSFCSVRRLARTPCHRRFRTMRKYVFQRVWTSLLTLFVVITLTFFMMRAIPGGPFTDEKGIPPHILAKIMERYRLSDPLEVEIGRASCRERV